MKTIIVAPQYTQRGLYYELPLGLAYISSSLKAAGHSVKFVNMNEEDLKEQDIREADVFCTGGLSTHYSLVKDIIKSAKAINPNITVVVGGGLISSMPEDMFMMLSPYIDIGVIGEGELEMVEILKDIQKAKDQRLITAKPIKNLDELPFPDYYGLKLDQYLDRQISGDEHYLYPVDKPRCVSMISSRSCPHNCSFCFHPLGREYRQRSLDNFFKELDMLVKDYKVNIIAVLDELLSEFPDRIKEFCSRIKIYNVKWFAQMRVDSVDEETLKMLKDSGCFLISYGIEHVNNEILKGYNKHTTIAQVERALSMTYDAGIGIQGNILLGGPHENDSTMQEAIAWRAKNKHYMINLTAVIPYPGTDLFHRAVKGCRTTPKQFIEQDCPYINFTGTTLHLPMQLMPATIVEIVSEGFDNLRGQINNIKVLCPHCGQIHEHKGIYWGATGAAFTQGQSYRIACKLCNQRYDINWSRHYQKRGCH